MDQLGVFSITEPEQVAASEFRRAAGRRRRGLPEPDDSGSLRSLRAEKEEQTDVSVDLMGCAMGVWAAAPTGRFEIP